jgi:hypothetical protein
MGEKSEQKKEKEISGIEEVPQFATGISIAAGRGGIIVLSFLFTPPEDEKKVQVISRTILPLEVAEALVQSLNDTLKKLREIEKKEEKKPET